MKNRWKILFSLLLLFVSCLSNKSKKLGLIDGNLSPCPDSPNCVSTRAIDQQHKMAPLPYTGNLNEMMEIIINTLNQQARVKIISINKNYIHAEFRTKIMRFVDDVEFYLDDQRKLIHFRSASRLGYSDLGVNRERMEKLVQIIKQNITGQ